MINLSVAMHNSNIWVPINISYIIILFYIFLVSNDL